MVGNEEYMDFGSAFSKRLTDQHTSVLTEQKTSK
jgi:hypothetical protein